MNVSLTATLEAYVRRKVATGLYNNASGEVREALRLMVERETGGQPAPRAVLIRARCDRVRQYSADEDLARGTSSG